MRWLKALIVGFAGAFQSGRPEISEPPPIVEDLRCMEKSLADYGACQHDLSYLHKRYAGPRIAPVEGGIIRRTKSWIPWGNRDLRNRQVQP